MYNEARKIIAHASGRLFKLILPPIVA